MKIIHISDTHGQHNLLGKLPTGDVLVHTGDVCRYSTRADVEKFMTWFDAQDYAHRIFIAGNHDKNCSKLPFVTAGGSYYLHNSSVEIEGVIFSGMPYTPTFFNWYFMADRGSLAMKEHVASISANTDVLLTHGPPMGFLDLAMDFDVMPPYPMVHVGCADLLGAYEDLRINPAVHCFGHIHGGYGHETYKQYEYDTAVRLYNGSSVNEKYELVNKPHEIEL